MWESNKQSYTFFLVGLALLFGIWFYFNGHDPVFAKKVLTVGVCFLLFTAGLISLYMARKGGSE